MPCKDKAGFKSKAEAVTRLRAIETEVALSENPKTKRPKRVYRCPECKQFHLTSITRKKWLKFASPEARTKNRRESEAEFWLNKLGVKADYKLKSIRKF